MRFWPGKISRSADRLLASTMALTVVPKRAAIWPTLSPVLTLYGTGVALAVGVIVGDAVGVADGGGAAGVDRLAVRASVLLIAFAAAACPGESETNWLVLVTGARLVLVACCCTAGVFANAMRGFAAPLVGRNHQSTTNPPMTAKSVMSAQGIRNRRRGASSKEAPQKKQT